MRMSGGTDGAGGARRDGRRRWRALAAVAVLALAVGAPAATADAAGLDWIPMSTGLYDANVGGPGIAYSALALGAMTYVGGEFTDAGGVAVNNIAAWDGTAFHPLGDPDVDGPTDVVFTLATDGTLLYAGGPFGVMAWDPATETWTDLTAPANVEAYTLLWYDDGSSSYLVLGGSAAGGTCRLLSYEGGGSWASAASITRTSNVCSVDALAQYGTQLVVGGTFDSINAAPFASVGIWDGNANTWTTLDGDTGDGVHDYTGGGDNVGSVFAIAANAGSGVIILGGSFDDAGGTTTTNLAMWQAGSFAEIGGAATQFDILEDEVDTLLGDSGAIVVGGWFSIDGNQTNVALLDLSTQQWQPVFGSVDDSVFTVAVNNTLQEVYVGGMFAEAYSPTTGNPILGTAGIARFGDTSQPARIISFSVSGTPVVGNTLTAHVVATGDPAVELSFQWLRCDAWVGLDAAPAERTMPERLLPPGCVEITGATGPTYRLVAADRGKYIGLVLVASNDVASAVDLRVLRSPVTAAPTPTTQPGSTTTTAPATTEPLIDELPATGGGGTAWPAAVLVVGGAVLLLVTRRRTAV